MFKISFNRYNSFYYAPKSSLYIMNFQRDIKKAKIYNSISEAKQAANILATFDGISNINIISC